MVRKAPAREAKAGSPEVPDAQRFLMIQEAAYYRAEHAGFCGDPMEHWLAAEKEIEKLIRG
jgi:hypothetical protein